MRITFTDVRALRESADRRSFSAAGKALGVSAQAVAKRIGQLEELTGVSLFERSAAGVELTRAGRQLDAAARPVLAEMEELERVIRRVAHGRISVTVAVSPTLVEPFLIPALRELEQRTNEGLSRVAVSITMANSNEVRDQVLNRRTDLGIAARDPEPRSPVGTQSLAERFLLEDEVVVAVGPEHDWAARQQRRDPVFIDEVGQTPMATRDAGSNVRQVFDAALRARGLELAEPMVEVGAARLVIDAARSAGCPALLSRLALRDSPQMVIVDLYERTDAGPRKMRIPRQFLLTYLGSDLSSEVQALIEFLAEAARAGEPPT
jgi:DNA-binding transcriptional LysR family regulator